MKKTLDLIYLPHPTLRKPSRKVGVIDAPIHQLVDALIEQAILWEGSREKETTVGLAAVQINQPWRVIIIREDFNNTDSKSFLALINPKITKYEGEIVEEFEGCLSVKDYYSRIPRNTKIRLQAKTLAGKEFSMRAEGFLARVLQHEIDHLKGVMTVDRASGKQDNCFRLLDASGKLVRVSHDKVKKSGILADD